MYKLLMSNCLRNSHTKKHQNRLIFDEVIGKIKRGAVFCGHNVERHLQLLATFDGLKIHQKCVSDRMPAASLVNSCLSVCLCVNQCGLYHNCYT